MFGRIAAALTHEARQRTADFGRWQGHRVLHIDGTGLSMPDGRELQKAFGQPGRQKPGCGFPVMHVRWLFDAATGLIIDFIPAPWNTHAMKHAVNLHASMEAGDVLVGDRAFGNYTHLALDQIVEYPKPKTRPTWLSAEDYAALPATVTVRERRYRVTQKGFRTKQVTLVTTLLDAETYARQELAELYGARWAIETNLKHLKTTMGMNVLHGKRVDGVLKGLWVYLIVYNQVRLFMLDAAQRQGAPPDRVSFIDALDVLRHHDRIVAAMITLTLNPHRPGRHEPRVIKRKTDCYTHMTKPRDALRKTLGITRSAA